MTESMSQHPEQAGHSSSAEFRGTIMCAICKAIYAPSRSHENLLQAPPIVLESAFMSMCHFCFRCRRPSCPNCWDSVHEVCGACVQEANLPFRMDPPPLHSVLVASHRPQLIPVRPSLAPLVCIHPGQLPHATPAPLPIDMLPTRPDRLGKEKS